jgi:hypothetical protein
VSNLILRDVEAMQADIASGKSARGRKAQGCGVCATYVRYSPERVNDFDTAGVVI